MQHMPALVDKVATACDRILNAFEGQDQPLSNNEKLAVASFKAKLISFAKYFMVFDDEIKGSISAALTQQTQSHKCYKDAARCCELFEQIMAIVDSFENDITVSSNTKAAQAAKAPAQEDDDEQEKVAEEAAVDEEKDEEKEVEVKAPIQPILPQDNKQSVGNAANPTTNGGLSVGQAGALAGLGLLSAIVPAVISSVTSPSSSTPDTKTEEKTSHVEAPKDAVDLKHEEPKRAETPKPAVVQTDEQKQADATALAAQVERDRVAQVERERVAAEQARIAAQREQERLAQVERDRLAQVERDRLAQVERERVATEQARIAAQREQERLAQVERDRLAQVERDRLAQVERERVAADQKQAKDAAEAPKQATVVAPRFTTVQKTRDYIVRTLPGLPALSIPPTNGSTSGSNATTLIASSSNAVSGSASSTTTAKQPAPIVPANDQKEIVALEKDAIDLYNNIQHPSEQASAPLFDKLIAIAQIYGKHITTNKRAAHMLGITEMAIDHVSRKFGNPPTEAQEKTLQAIYPADGRWFIGCRRAALPAAVAAIKDPEHLFEIWSCSHVVRSTTQANLIQTRINALDEAAEEHITPAQVGKEALATFPVDFVSHHTTLAKQVIWNKLMIQAQNVIAAQDVIHEIETRNLLRRALSLNAIGEYALIFQQQLAMIGDAPTVTDEIPHADTALSSVSMMSSSSASAS
jgi:hypothetical protein